MAVKKQRDAGQAWFCSTGLPSDIVIEVHEMSFHLHKFPLMSKSNKLHRLITMLEQNPSAYRPENLEADDLHLRIYLPDFPGGPITFESAAKFCYGINVTLTAATAAPLRCAAEYLEMTELISRTDHYLTKCALRSLKSSTTVLKSCDDLVPDAEELGIVQRCIDSIAALSWPIKDGIDDLATLSFPVYKRVISAMRDGHSSPEAIESSLITYAKRSIPGISRSSRKHQVPSSPASAPEKREQLEMIITQLSLEKISPGSDLITARFLSGLLRTANILKSSESYRTAVERRIALQLHEATLDDLLIPSYSSKADTLYDVGCVERILDHYRAAAAAAAEEEGYKRFDNSLEQLMRVGRLVDCYLCEIGSDAGLTADRFCRLAEVLPGDARRYDDGLYRAVDVFMRAHSGMTEEERERVCGVVDCRKLTMEACAHAAGNERLPLRAVVGVLFREQMEMRRAVEEEVGSKRSGGNDVMWLDMESVRGRVRELERECARMRKVIANGRRGGIWRRLGCKSAAARVCDSQVARRRRSRGGATGWSCS